MTSTTYNGKTYRSIDALWKDLDEKGLAKVSKLAFWKRIAVSGWDVKRAVETPSRRRPR